MIMTFKNVHGEAMARAFSALCVSWILAHAGQARALHPLATEDAGTLGQARVEVELALIAERFAGSRMELAQTWAAHVGVSSRLDLGATLAATSDGLLSAQASAKLRLFDGNEGAPALAVRFDLAPFSLLGDAGPPAAGALAVTSWDWSEGAVHVNLGTRCDRESGQRARCLLVSALAAVLFPIAGLTVGADATLELASDEEQSVVGQAVVVHALGQSGSISLGAGLVWDRGRGSGWTATVGYTFATGGT